MSITLGNTAITFSDSSVQSVAAKMLNVQQTVITNVVTFTSASYTDVSGLAVTITPKSTSSRIIVYASFIASSSDSSSNTVYQKNFRFTRNGTVIAVGDARGSSIQATASGGGSYSSQTGVGVFMSWQDSPATTSAVTYQVQGTCPVAMTVGGTYSTSIADQCSAVSTITAIEVSP